MRLENRGELNWIVCLSLVGTMGVILTMGLLSVLQPVQDARSKFLSDDPMHLFAPGENHMAFLWLVSSLLMLVFIPFIVTKAYRGAMTFTFRNSDNIFLKNRRPVTRLDRIEYLILHETFDPDSRYIYRLYVVYGDGREQFLHNGYDEREVMNLANEVSTFVRRPVKWR